MATALACASGRVRRASPVSTPPGPTSTKRVAPMPARVSRLWRQRTGLHSWADSSPGHSSAAVWARASTLATTGISGTLKGVLDRDLRSHDRAGAMSVVWKAPATGKGHHLAGAELLGDGTGRATASAVPAITTCPGAL